MKLHTCPVPGKGMTIKSTFGGNCDECPDLEPWRKIKREYHQLCDEILQANLDGNWDEAERLSARVNEIKEIATGGVL